VTDAARNEQASGMTAGSRSVDRIVGCFILGKGFDSSVAILSPDFKLIFLQSMLLSDLREPWKPVGEAEIIPEIFVRDVASLRNMQSKTKQGILSENIFCRVRMVAIRRSKNQKISVGKISFGIVIRGSQ
jgi:hypothetical protein